MSFVADESAMRTYDPQSGAELFVISGGSDGSTHFELRYANKIVPFSAEKEAVENSDRVDWHIRSCQVEYRKAIAEALQAFGFGHGFWADKIRTVKFLEKRKRFFGAKYEWVDA